MSAYTPGPWKVLASDVMKSIEIGAGSEAFARIYPSSHRWPNPTAEANARLIAAAPDLLDALKKLRRFVAEGQQMNGREFVGLGIEVNAAIEKADGSR